MNLIKKFSIFTQNRLIFINQVWYTNRIKLKKVANKGAAL